MCLRLLRTGRLRCRAGLSSSASRLWRFGSSPDGVVALLLFGLGLTLWLGLLLVPWSTSSISGAPITGRSLSPSTLRLSLPCRPSSALLAAYVVEANSDTVTPEAVPWPLLACAGDYRWASGATVQLVDVSSVSGSTSSPGILPGPELFLTFVGLALLALMLLAVIAGLLMTR